jgi:hypothetical protein
LVTIRFIANGVEVGTMTTSLEAFDTSPHNIPIEILNRISNLENVQIAFSVDE